MRPDTSKEAICLLYEASVKFRSADSIAGLYTSILGTLKESLRVDLTSLWILSKEERLVTCVGAEGHGKEQFDKTKVELGEGSLGQWMENRREHWISRDNDPENLTSKFSREWGAKVSFLSFVPLFARVELLGAILIAHRDLYREDKRVRNIDFLRKIGDSAGLAIEDLRNRERLAKRIRDLTTLSEVTTELSGSLDLEKVLQTLLYSIVGHFLVENIAILLPDEKKELLVPVESHDLPEDILTLDFSCQGQMANALCQMGGPIFRSGLGDFSIPLEEEQRLEKLKASLLVPMFVHDELLGVITLGDKLTKEPYDESEIEFLSTIAAHAGIAIKNAVLFQAEKKAGELSLLLEISKEVTATLDLDRILHAFVNLSSQVIDYDRAAVALYQRDNLIISAVSGQEKVNRKAQDISMLEGLLSWVGKGKNPVYVTSLEGEIQAENEDTKQRVAEYFEVSQKKSLLAIPLVDEEGTLGVASMESEAPNFMTESGLEVVEILSNQLTVAIRNAELYQQIPLKKVIQPIVEKKRAIFKMPRRKMTTIAVLVGFILAFSVLWKGELKVSCPVEIWPQLTYTVTAEVEGIIQQVLVREGQLVKQGQLLATLYDEDIHSRLNQVQVQLRTSQGNARSLFAANRINEYQIERNQINILEAEFSLLKTLQEKTQMVSPVYGTILTPRLEERIGEFLEKGDALCQVANLKQLRAEIQFPGKDIDFAEKDQKIKLLVSAYPEKTFWGKVQKVSSRAEINEEEKSFLVLGNVDNVDGMLRPGMTGQAKVYCGKRSLAYVLFRKPARLFRELVWRIFGF